MTATARGHILHIDDDHAVAKVLAGLLGQVGYHVDHVASGPAGLAHIEQRGADLVILDLRMPEMDGMEVLSVLDERRPDLPVIMLTAHGTVPTAVDAMRRGAADFILKPFDRDELIYAVDKALAFSERSRREPPEAASRRSRRGA